MNKFKVTKLANNDFLKHNKVGSIIERDPNLVEHMVRTGELEPVSQKTIEPKMTSTGDTDVADKMKSDKEDPNKLKKDEGKK